MHKKKKIISAIIIVVLTICVAFWCVYNKPTKKPIWNLENIELNEINNIMIVAHPDDETLWGSRELIEEQYLVVCITCGTNETREEEIKRVMNKTNDIVLMLGYPDKTHGKRDDWSKIKEELIKDLKKILEYKKWQKIITHNPDGEYGHEHHKMTNKYVTNIVEDKENLIYFGHYYSKKKIADIEDNLMKMKEDILDYKINELLIEYKSQGFLDEKFSQMYPYENYIHYKDWSNEE